MGRLSFENLTGGKSFGINLTHRLNIHLRFRKVPTFGRGTIRRFANNVSEMKKLAGREFEDILQVSRISLFLSPDLSVLSYHLIDSASFLCLRVSSLKSTTTSCWTSYSNLRHGTGSQNSEFTLTKQLICLQPRRRPSQRQCDSSSRKHVKFLPLWNSQKRLELVDNAQQHSQQRATVVQPRGRQAPIQSERN